MGFESRMDIWLRFDGYTPYRYNKILQRIHTENDFSKLISTYPKAEIGDAPKSLSKRYLIKNLRWLPGQNVQFIQNARETYEAGLRASSHIRPILYHYSWHSFFAFLMYTFMKFDGPAKGHGITVSKMERNEINLVFHPPRKKGFFQRTLDVMTILGYPLVFARWIPVVKEKEITFVENNISPFADVERINLGDIVTFDAKAYIDELTAKFKFKQGTKDLVDMNHCIMSFVMHLAASTITRYKPKVWTEILEGEREYESMILRGVRQAYGVYVYFVTQIHSHILKKYEV